MRYLGGKARIAKRLAAVILENTRGLPLWEPFCGGLNISTELHPVLCSDVDVALMSLILAVRDGWIPPENVDEGLYRYARTLPETNPLHGFCAFGCSFGGMKWSTYARCNRGDNFARQSSRAIVRQLSKLMAVEFACLSFFDDPPIDPGAIYCDPPYRNRTGYAHKFDHAAFDARCQELANAGKVVLVSEYTKPNNNSRLIWETVRNAELRGREATHTERLYLIKPMR